MTAQHKPPYLRRLGFAADPLCFRSKPPLDPSSLILIVGHSMPLDVDQKEEAFPWAGKVAASSLSFSRFRSRILSLGERCTEALLLTQGGLPPLRLMRTRFSRRERSNERG
ncbi:hypothetical protein Salat_2987800 [Sesamum alatum]|uniref:Uncharacterized protein n=1 Tax=Sesamum alatum TaxID=300844 RepID=A0AAE2C7S9_9LAMI|nr:hypothetical protein Salat_2964700 [Sesamum alatum]KAK4412256.1 hypothetical protein Salat_2987800 [Sesamum alatum]